MRKNKMNDTTAEEKKIWKRIVTINPSEEDVNSMSEYDWMTRIYPIKVYQKGLSDGKKAGRREVFEKIDNIICKVPYEKEGNLNLFLIDYIGLKKDLTSAPQTPQTKPDRVKSDNGRNFVKEQFGQEGQTEESSSEGCGEVTQINDFSYRCGERYDDDVFICENCEEFIRQKQEKRE